MTDVAIVGIGIHPFGRHDGVSGSAMGAFATRQALRDAGAEWKDVQFAYGGSLASMLPGSEGSGSGTPDTLVNELGLTGLQFVNVVNGCATAGSALHSAVLAIQSGAFDVGIAVGFDKHPRGHFNADPASAWRTAWAPMAAPLTPGWRPNGWIPMPTMATPVIAAARTRRRRPRCRRGRS